MFERGTTQRCNICNHDRLYHDKNGCKVYGCDCKVSNKEDNYW